MKNLFYNIRHAYGDLSLQKKLLLMTLLCLGIPFVLIMFWIPGRYYTMTVADTIRQEQDASAETAPIIDDLMNQILGAYDILTEQEFYKTATSKKPELTFSELFSPENVENFEAAINDLTERTPVTDVTLYTPSLSDSDASKEDGYASFTDFISNISANYWYGIFQGSHPSELFCPPFYLGRKEKDKRDDMAYIRKLNITINNEEYVCYLALYFSSEQLSAILKDNLEVKGSVSYIMNERDALVASSDTSLSGIYWLSYDSIQESFMSSNNYIEQTILDEKVYVCFYSINETGWFMVTVIPSSPLLARSARMTLATGGVFLICVLLAILLSMVLSRSITTPLFSVIRQMGQVKTEPPVPMESPEYHDEVGELIDTYNYMAHKMNNLMDEQQKAAEELRIAEFNSLQAQINPHFLYNTMDMINWMAQQGRTAEISSAVQNLSRFYKLTLSKKASISTVADEEEHVSIYVKLQNMRFQNSIEFVSDIPDELLKCQIPKLTLQPIVENAILHGILEKDNKRGTIVLTGWMEDEDMVLLISDDGVGISEDKLKEITSGRGSSSGGGTNIAIYNTHKRLQLLYGSGYGLFYSSSQGKGTEVEVRIPIR